MWVWCSHCERCYLSFTKRWISGLPICHYADCSGSYLSSWPWQTIRRLMPEYPVTPSPGERYPASPEAATLSRSSPFRPS